MNHKRSWPTNRLGKRTAHSRGAVLVGVIPALEQVGEEKELKHSEYHNQLYDYDSPQLPAYCHRPESVGIKSNYAARQIHYPTHIFSFITANCKNILNITNFCAKILQHAQKKTQADAAAGWFFNLTVCRIVKSHYLCHAKILKEIHLWQTGLNVR